MWSVHTWMSWYITAIGRCIMFAQGGIGSRVFNLNLESEIFAVVGS